jgi:hypothetical protein
MATLGHKPAISAIVAADITGLAAPSLLANEMYSYLLT